MPVPEVKPLVEVRAQVDLGVITMGDDEPTTVLDRFQPQ
jgi:hypothetical protein